MDGGQGTGNRLPPDRVADPLCAQCPHAQRGAGGADRGVDPRVRLDQPGAGGRGERDHRGAWPGAGGAEAGLGRGAGDRTWRT